MPIYEYRCSDCGFQDEFLQKHSDPVMTVCPSCGKESLKKLLSAAGFQLKGSGWYATDFKGSGKPAAKSDDPKPEGKPSGDAAAGEKSPDKASGEKSASDKGGDKPASSSSATPPSTTG
jgi:putative FmdB family regulatory protein